ncbi:peptide chain release factor [Clostridia bacterium]|nr:peptide chain release factor [Clostridia bacterium]
MDKLTRRELRQYAHLSLDALDAYCTHQASRSSGPGGQAVNTSATKVLSIFTPDPSIRAVSQRERSQYLNRRENLAKIHKKLLNLSTPVKMRIDSKPSKAAQQRRLDAKAHRSAIKKTRKKTDDAN